MIDAGSLGIDKSSRASKLAMKEVVHRKASADIGRFSPRLRRALLTNFGYATEEEKRNGYQAYPVATSVSTPRFR